MGNQARDGQSTVVVGGQTSVPFARRGVADDQHQGACRRVSFGHSLRQAVVGKSFSVSTHKITAVGTEIKIVLGEFVRKSFFHLPYSNLIYLGGDNDRLGVDCGVEASDALPSSQDPDFSCLVHFDSWLHPIVGPAVGVTSDVVTAESVEDKGVAWKLAVERLFHLPLGDVIIESGGDDSLRVDGSGDAGIAFAPTSGPDLSLFVIGRHFGPPVSLLI